MRATYVVIVSLAALGLCVAGGYAWHTALWRMGWFEGPPALAKGMRPQAGELSAPWSYRLRRAFPVGFSERQMTDQLRRQGFKVDAERRRAAYGWAAYPCIYTLTVSWRADQSRRVRDVTGGLLNACTDPDKLIPERSPRRRGPETEGPGRRLVPKSQSA